MRPNAPNHLVVASVAFATFGLAGCLDQAATPALFVSTLGDDTVTVERVLRIADMIEGELIERNPMTQRIRYQGVVADDGTVDRLEATVRTPAENPDGPGEWSFSIVIDGDTAVVTREGGDNPGTLTVPVEEDAIPSLGRIAMAAFVLDEVLRQAGGADVSRSVSFQLVQPTRPRPAENAVTPHAGDTVAVDLFGNPLYVWTSDGRLEGASGRATTMKVEMRRTDDDLSMDSLASRWAAMDARGEGLGVPSPGATTTATVDGTSIEVRYSQPAVRGREIWGGLVPWDEVWRTGANAATHFTTDRDLRLGELLVPAGSYTLWSTYTPDSAHLIVNRQTDQWGTQYDPAQDLGRVEMERTALDTPVERFTISIEEDELRLEWAETRFSAPITVPE